MKGIITTERLLREIREKCDDCRDYCDSECSLYPYRADFNDNSEGERSPEFEITEHIGVVFVYANGWKKEFDFVAWNDGTSRNAIREWSPDRERMPKDIMLDEAEAEKLFHMLKWQFEGRKSAVTCQ